jgi:hypothetical protein
MSVAGESAEVIEQAKRMLKDKYPIAIAKDSLGRHRGVPMEMVRTQLRNRKMSLSDDEILDAYRDMWTEPDDEDYRRVLRIIRKAKNKYRSLAKVIDRAVQKQGHRRRFCVVFKRAALEGVLARIPMVSDQTVVLGFHKNQVAINGRYFEALEGTASGAQVMYRADLETLVHTDADNVALEVFTGQWFAYLTFPIKHGKVRQVGPLEFNYPKHREGG